ncbi:MAG: ATP-binding protein [Actinomycetota bacterium]|nr:ATP-binding protein [Actinomycetota bacterium]
MLPSTPSPSLEVVLADPERLAALHSTELLDSEPEAGFDRLTQLAARVIGVPVAVTSLVDDRRQFFKSCVGISGSLAEDRGTPLSHSFCKHVVHSRAALVIPDAREHALVRNNPAITELGVIAYLGVPLTLPGGQTLGSLCAVDSKPRDWSDEDVMTLHDVAQSVVTEITLRADVRRLRQVESELERARDEAVAACGAKSEFLANMSHEIRTPLNGVIGMADLLARTQLDSEQRDYVKTIAAAGGALLEVISDILDFSKIEAGKIVLERHEFDLHELVTETGRMMLPQTRAKGLELRIDLASDVRRLVIGDRSRLRQVLANLLSNAVKFTDRGSVEVRVRADNLADGAIRVCMEVHDTGIGIAPDRLEAVFESFTQADASTTRRYGGTGLGLAISQRLVDLMGGRIEVDSIVGRGTCFTVTLPMKVGTTEVAAVVQRAADIAVGRDDTPALGAGHERHAPRALLVEDNPINQIVAEALLTECGLDVCIAEDGLAALEEFERGCFQVVLMDCQMPRMDGYEATRRIRECEADTGRVPIIAMTANAMAGDRERCLQAEMDDYLAKPLTKDAIERVLREWIAVPHRA